MSEGNVSQLAAWGAAFVPYTMIDIERLHAAWRHSE